MLSRGFQSSPKKIELGRQAQSLKCLFYKPEDLSWIPMTMLADIVEPTVITMVRKQSPGPL